ncbi:DUF4440 domain-containing protein [Halarcobacter sp.]|uniref:DUF4440 domain-containing protein n=1 Tax=Halarcobacter sp. TaxID=2321133 RepID=UPI002AAB8098|nr:DUF4440 domain-containing protein [Halarcobacter sp.]
MKKPIDILKKWMEGINTASAEKLISLYDKEAVLIPTFSNRISNTPEKIKDYFEKLGSKENLSITLHDKTLNILEVGEQVFSLSGIYTWRFDIDEEPMTFEARFSYVFDLKKTSPILSHHSSQIPRSL